MVIESAEYPYSTEYIEEVAAYVRVSTTEQKMHGVSIDAQKQKLAEYAENHNMKIVEWYIDEGVSGAKPIAKRPELQRMVQDAEKGRFRRIIFIKLDRFFRSLAEYHEAMKRIDPVVWTATEEKYDLSTANGRAFVNMKLTIAELEADTGGERVKIVNDYKVKSGMPLFGAQCLPFCYTIKDDGNKKSIVKENQEIMEDAISHVMLNHSISGALVYVKNKHKTKIGYKSLVKAFRNEMICGSYRGNPNYCPPYITREMFDKLQTIVNRNPRTSKNEYSYIFSGLIRCPKCGNRMKGSFNTTRGRRYYGYRCDKSLRDKECEFKTIVFENRLEKLMLNRVEEYILEQELENIEISKQDIVSKYDVEELRGELDRLNYAWQKGRIKSVEEYDKKYDALVEKIEEAEKAIPDAPPDFSHIKAILSDGWEAIYKAMDNDHKKAFWRSFVKDIYLDWTKERKEIADIDFF